MINFLHVRINVVETQHVVQNRTVGIRRYPSSDFIEERKTTKEVTFHVLTFQILSQCNQIE